ncbi:MAG: hypothetical protein MUD14_03400, partial [Hydrococcus sp. Prado102]|nr:hypothetical protein [Hydrococcus sp. Prado102]
QEIQDKAAIAFATGFYRALAFGKSLDHSFKFGCNAIQLQDSPHIISRMRSAASADARELVFIGAEAEIEQRDIPEHLKPILLKKETIISPYEVPIFPSQEQDIKVDIAKSIIVFQEYRKKVQDFFKEERKNLDTATDLNKIDKFLDTPSLSVVKKALLKEETEKKYNEISEENANRIIEEEQKKIKLAQDKYKQVVFEIICDNNNDEISIHTQEELNALRDVLELSNAEASQIQKKMIDKYQKYNQALKDYKNVLTNLIDTQYPLSETSQIELKELQQNHHLKPEDIEKIQAPIIEQAKVRHQEKIQRYENRVERYKQEFISKIQFYPFLNEDFFIYLKQIQLECNLSDEDKDRIEKSAITEISLKSKITNSNKAILALDFNKNKQIIGSGGGDIKLNFFPPINPLNANDNKIEFWDISNEQLRDQILINQPYNIIHNWMGRTGVINSIAFSADGEIVASGSSDNTIKLWWVESKLEICTFFGHVKAVNSVVFSPDGQLVASGSSDKTIKLWNAWNGKETRTLSGHTNIIHSVVFSPDGQLVASGSGDNTIKIWNVNEGKEIYTLNGHSNVVRSITFSPDAKTLASGSSDGTVKLWNTWNGKEIRTLFEHSDQIISIAFSPDGEILASGSSDGIIKLWDIKSNVELVTLFAHSDWVSSVVFSHNDRLVSGSKDKTIKIWKIYRL